MTSISIIKIQIFTEAAKPITFFYNASFNLLTSRSNNIIPSFIVSILQIFIGNLAIFLFIKLVYIGQLTRLSFFTLYIFIRIFKCFINIYVDFIFFGIARFLF